MEVSNLQGQLSQKERLLLEDLKSEEELCVVKYQNYAQQAQDPQLSQLFSGIADVEQGHYDTVNQLLQSGGQSSGQQGQGGKPGGQMNQATGNISLGQAGSNSSGADKYLLQDMLTIEKHVSSAYNTSIFEMTQPNIKQALQHIQKEEQDHGEQLYQYMSSHGMYQAQ
jgi:spore coat protein CotF